MTITRFPHGISSFGVPLYGDGMFGPATGNLFYLVTGKTSSDKFYTLLDERGTDDQYIFTSLASAHAAMTADQGDTLIVMPGLHTQTTTCDWTKDRTNLIGVASPNILGRSGRPNCMIHTDTAGVDYAVHLTGNFCQFYNVGLSNGNTGGAATTANLSSMMVAGYGNYFKKVSFRGMMSAAQKGVATCSSLEIGQAGECEFDECMIGWNAFGITRTLTTGGHLLFSWAGAPPSAANMVFKNCLFSSRAETAGVVMVYFNNDVNTDRILLFENCHFDNFWVNWAGICTAVFERETGQQTTNLDLRNCTARGYERWIGVGRNLSNTGGAWIEAGMPITGLGGGLQRAPTSASGS